MPNQSYEEGSPAEFAHQALLKIQQYAESEDPVETLIALNALVFVFVLGFTAASWLAGSTTIFSVSFLVILVVSLVFMAITSLAYIPLLETIASLGSHHLTGLRFAIIAECVALTAALAGLLFDRQLLLNAAFVLLIFQLFIPLMGGILPALGTDGSAEREWGSVWTALGRGAVLISVGTFVVDVLLFLIRYGR